MQNLLLIEIEFLMLTMITFLVPTSMIRFFRICLSFSVWEIYLIWFYSIKMLVISLFNGIHMHMFAHRLRESQVETLSCLDCTEQRMLLVKTANISPETNRVYWDYSALKPKKTFGHLTFLAQLFNLTAQPWWQAHTVMLLMLMSTEKDGTEISLHFQLYCCNDIFFDGRHLQGVPGRLFMSRASLL